MKQLHVVKLQNSQDSNQQQFLKIVCKTQGSEGDCLPCTVFVVYFHDTVRSTSFKKVPIVLHLIISNKPVIYELLNVFLAQVCTIKETVYRIIKAQ